MRALVLFTCALAVAVNPACKRADVLVADVPVEVEVIAVVELDDAGRVVRATPIVEWDAGEAVPLTASAARVIVAGWPRATIEGIAPARLAAPLRAVEGCALALPAPMWAAAWSDDGLTSLDVATVPRLGADWLEDRCGAGGPSVDLASIDVSLDCRDQRCAPARRSTRPCVVELELEDCGLAPLEATVQLDGTLCVEPEQGMWRCAPTVPLDAREEALACTAPEACTVSLFARDPEAPPPFVLETRRYSASTPWDPVRPPGTISPAEAHVGLGFDVVALRDRVFVAHAPAFEGRSPCRERPGVVTFLWGFDAATLEVVVTSAQPSCLEALAPDVEADRFVGAFHSVEGWQLGRFDREGQLVDQRPITSVPSGEEQWVVRRILLLREHGWIAALFTADELVPDRTRVTFHDAVSLEEEWHADLLDGQAAFELAFGGGDRLYLLAFGVHRVASIDLEGRRLHGDRIVPIELDRLNVLQDLHVRDARGALFVVAQGTRKLVSLEQDGRVFTRAPPSTGADLLRIHPWPGVPGLMLVAGTFAPEGGAGRRAELVLYDVDAERFRPGVWDVGGGIISRIVEDPGGRLWLLYPWTGILGRLEPRPL
ncbi:hypothetical protein L6R52_27225 [Myxococcota bacterium]|nr:hypothetical protein [Myxococcota bacterium]